MALGKRAWRWRKRAWRGAIVKLARGNTSSYIPSFVEIGLPVPEIFKGFLPYMGMAAILVM